MFCLIRSSYFYCIFSFTLDVKIYIVDNGGQWTHREWRVLRYLNVDTRIIPNTTPFNEIRNIDGLILSGGSLCVSLDASSIGNNGDYLRNAGYPILGICAGMQYLCKYFGGVLGPCDKPEFGGVDISISSHGDIFKGLPDRFNVWASHNDEVKSIPEGFEVIARSESCPFEAVRCKTRPLFGVQFHPEVENTEHGTEIFQNFIDTVREARC